MWESCDSSKFPTPSEFRQLLRNATVVPLAVAIVSSDGSTAACAGVDLKLASAGDDISGHSRSDSAATVAAADVVLRTSVVSEVRHRSC